MIDDVDRVIIRELVKNARASFRELGERVALSPNATAMRVRRLVDAGVIAGFHAAINPAATGRPLTALMDVRLSGPADSARFEQLIESVDAVTDVVHVTGRFDYSMRVNCADPTDLDRLLRLLKSKGGVAETDTRIALRTVVRRGGPGR